MSHSSIVSLLIIFRLILVRPDIIVVFIELVKLLDDFTWTNLYYLLLFVIIVASSTLFLALALRLLFLALTFGFFGTFTVALSIFAVFFFFLYTVIESLNIIGGLASSLSFLSLDPISALLKHLFFDLVLFHVVNLFLNVSLGVEVVVHVRFLDLFALIHSLFSPINGLVLRFATHTQENHLFLAKIIDTFASQNSL
jgi:hypothetical protein